MDHGRILVGYSQGNHQLQARPDGHEIPSEEKTLIVQKSPRVKTRTILCNDEKSEKSVRDKIAMFSEQSAFSISTNVPICRKLPSREVVRPNQSPPSPDLKNERNVAVSKATDQNLSGISFKPDPSTVPTSKPSSITLDEGSSYTLPRLERTTGTGLIRAVSFTGGTKLHCRSQSMVDIGSRTPFKSSDDSRKLSTMIEQRKRCISKLRGLVIPEKVVQVPHFVDLPEIKSRDCPLPVSLSDQQNQQENNVATLNAGTTHVIKPTSSLIPSPPWKSVDSSLPKYSPAFKRKSLTVYEKHVSSWLGSNDQTGREHYFDLVPSRLNVKSTPRALSPTMPTKATESRDEESDNDSAVSSSRSDLSHSPTNDLNLLPASRNLNVGKTFTPELASTCDSSPESPSLLVSSNSTSGRNEILPNKNKINLTVEDKENVEHPLVEDRSRQLSNEINGNTEHKEKIISNNVNVCPPRISTSENHSTALHEFSKVKSSKCPLLLYKNNSNGHNNNIASNGIKRSFEKSDSQIKLAGNVQHPRVSSIDSTTSDDSLLPAASVGFGSVSNLQKEQQFGSITSLASSTSLISQQELSQLIEEANHTLEDTHEVIVAILHRDNPGGSIGITLAGGADYEAKEITVHKVLVGSPAERDGRIQKGDRILSINGKSMKGLTHYESLAILKAPRPEVVLVVSRHKSDNQEENSLLRCHVNSVRSPRFIEPPRYSITPSDKENEVKWGPIETIVLRKDGTGLGFSLEGGKDSPYGDMPLIIKKIFTGGCAEKCRLVNAGDELLSVNGFDITGLSRIEAWALMKRLPDGRVSLTIRHPLLSPSS